MELALTVSGSRRHAGRFRLYSGVSHDMEEEIVSIEKNDKAYRHAEEIVSIEKQ